MFSCEYCEMFRNTYSEEQLRTAAPACYPRVPPKGATLGSHPRVLRVESHLRVLGPTFLVCNFIKKETLAQVFSCEFCEISKNTFFKEHPWATASDKTFLRQSKEMWK